MSENRIYTSSRPQVHLQESSLWHYLFPATSNFHPSQPAFIEGHTGRQLTRAEVEDVGLRVKTGLNRLGLHRGDTACLWGLNSLEWVKAGYGVMAAGMIASTANASYEAKEIAHQLNNSGSTILFLDPECVPRFEEARANLDYDFPTERVYLLTTREKNHTKYGVVDDLVRERGVAEVFSGKDIHNTCWLGYSSGTTGLPKGVKTSHHNFTSQLSIVRNGYQPLSQADVLLGFVPLTHVYGSVLVLTQPFSVGCTAVILPRFDEKAALESIQNHKVTHALFVPPVFITLVHSKILSNYDISSLTSIVSAAAPLSSELIEAFKKRVPQAVITQAYGLTETSPLITAFTTAEAAGHDGHIGPLLPSWEARLVDLDGNDVPIGERGELWVRGPCVMRGYHKNPEATANAMHNEWFKTGDVVVVHPDGFLQVVDRVKELIKFKGFQVPPAELEALLITHPKITDVAVLGLYDKNQATELPAAFVTTDETINGPADAAAFDKEIQAWVAGRVAKHKRLAGGVHIVDAVPKTPSGKILRRFLREKGQAEYDAKLAAAGVQAKL